jgi:uncharacterized protein (TIGR03435 family)
MRRVIQTVMLVVCLALATSAQQVEAPHFDVVSIKRNTSGAPNSSIRPDVNGVTATNVTTRRLLRLAFQVADFQIVDGPSWFDSEHYDVIGRAAGAVPTADLAPMVRALLEDRFGVRAERTSLPVAGFELRLDRAGHPGLKPSDQPCTITPNPPPSTGATQAPQRACLSTFAGEMSAQGVTGELLARQLTAIARQPVVDRTGLTGAYDFDLRWRPDTIGGEPPPDPNAPPLVTAVREQLGLRLVAARPVVDVYVITAAHRPEPD